METNSFNYCTNKLCFTCFKPDVEEHTCCIWVFKRASVTVKPRGEDYTVRTGRDCINNFFKVVIHIKFNLFKAIGSVTVLFKKYADFIKCKVVFNPANAFVRCFKLCKVIECCRVSTYDSSNHSACINSLLFNYCSDPA